MHTSTRMLVCGWAERCHMVPSPLAGEGQGGGYNTHCLCFVSVAQQMRASCRSRVFLHRTNFALPALSPPLSLSLPRKGGGNRVARTFASHAMCLRHLPKICACPSAEAGTNG